MGYRDAFSSIIFSSLWSKRISKKILKSTFLSLVTLIVNGEDTEILF